MNTAIRHKLATLGMALLLGLLTASAAAASTISVDGKYDPNEGYDQSFTMSYYGTDGTVYTGYMYQYIDPVSSDLYLAFVMPIEVNDTSYGSASTGYPFNWPGKGRKFDQIVGSDHVQISIASNTGDMLLDVLLDDLAKYEMSDGSVEYRSSGVTNGNTGEPGVKKVRQGDGQVLTGDASMVLASGTSFDYNYNTVGYQNTATSPTPGTVDGWIDEAIFEIMISGDALTDAEGNFIYGSANLVLAHLSPEKVGIDSIGPPVPTGGAATPEPATLLLMASAFAWLAVVRLRQRAVA